MVTMKMNMGRKMIMKMDMDSMVGTKMDKDKMLALIMDTDRMVSMKMDKDKMVTVKMDINGCSLLHSCQLATFGPNIFLSTLFLNTFSLCSSLNVRDQVSHPQKPTGKIVSVNINSCFLDSKLEDKIFYTE